MNKFKVGDKVRRTRDWGKFKVGYIGEVSCVDSKDSYFRGSMHLVGSHLSHAVASYELINTWPKEITTTTWQREDGSVCDTYEEASGPAVVRVHTRWISKDGSLYLGKHQDAIGAVTITSYTDGTFNVTKDYIS
jgi:hypothetical protein